MAVRMWACCLTIFWTSLTFFAGLVYSIEGIVKTLGGRGTPHIGDVESCLAGTKGIDGNLRHARFNYPWGIVYDQMKQAVYVADCGCPDTDRENDRIRKIDLTTKFVTTTAGSLQGFKDGPGQEARFTHIAGMILNQKKRQMYVADSANDVIRVVDLQTKKVGTFAGSPRHKGFKDGPIHKARFNNPQQLELHESVARMFVGDTDNHAVRVILMNKNPPIVHTVTGGPGKEGFLDGSLSKARWKHPTGIAYDMHRDVLYVSDHYNHAVRKIDLTKGQVTTIMGNGSPGSIHQTVNGIALMHYPEGIVHDPTNDVLYVAEFANNCIRVINLQNNSVHLLAGGQFGTRDGVGARAQFYHPTSMDFDSENKLLYVTDQYNHRIRTVTTLGNLEVANPSYMLAKHFVSIDAYRDILIHNHSTAQKVAFAFVFLDAIIILYCVRRCFARACIKNFIGFSFVRKFHNKLFIKLW